MGLEQKGPKGFDETVRVEISADLVLTPAPDLHTESLLNHSRRPSPQDWDHPILQMRKPRHREVKTFIQVVQLVSGRMSHQLGPS